MSLASIELNSKYFSSPEKKYTQLPINNVLAVEEHGDLVVGTKIVSTEKVTSRKTKVNSKLETQDNRYGVMVVLYNGTELEIKMSYSEVVTMRRYIGK